MVSIGLNYLDMSKYVEAQKTFEKCLKTFPDGSHGDDLLLGIITAQINLEKPDQAQETFEQLKTKYPNSTATEQAKKFLHITTKQ